MIHFLIYIFFSRLPFPVLQGYAVESKADLTGGLLLNVEESSGSVDNQKAEARAPSSQVVVPEERNENGGNEAEGSHLAANAGSLSEPIEKEEGMKTSSLYHPVTREEMQKLKETENLFRSNLLKLQVLCPRPHTLCRSW